MEDEALKEAPWWSSQWLDIYLLQDGFVYEEEWYLWMIPFVLLIFPLRWILGKLNRGQLKMASFKQEFVFDPWSLFRFVAPLFASFCLVFLLIALARPQKTNLETPKYTLGIDIMVSLDISESMELADLKPNRLEATKSVASEFVAGRKGDRIGLTIFSGEAYSLCPLTNDHELVQSYIKDLDFDLIQKNGTAIGSALGVSLNRMRESVSNSRVIILLSDGENNAGNLDPLAVAEMASAFDVKVYTIAVGLEGQIPVGKDPFGRVQYAMSNIDIPLLKKIAEQSNGRFFRATNTQALKEIFEEIDNMEKTEVLELEYKNTVDYYYIYLYWAMVCLGLFFFFKLPFFSNALTD